MMRNSGKRKRIPMGVEDLFGEVDPRRYYCLRELRRRAVGSENRGSLRL